MAKVVVTEQQVIAESWAMWVRTIVLGALLGIIFWVIALLIGHYIVEPLTCRQIVNASLCLNATPLAGKIAAVLVAVIAVFALIRLNAARPIILAVGTAALLWDLSAWTLGLFWLEAIAWSIILYALCFALFAWITRYAALWVTVVVSLLIVIAIRIALVF